MSEPTRPDNVRRWSHDMRNAANSLRLCTSALPICENKAEKLEMIDQIGLAADKLILLVDTIPAELTPAEL